MFIFISLAVLLFSLFYIYRRRKISLFSQYNISGPPPNFIFGNLIEYRKNVFYELFNKWEQKYGKVFVYFEGPTPNVVIADPNLIQDVLVKQFSNFHGRKLFPFQKNPDEDEKVNMFFARGKRWKRLRTTINPAFSDSKMRRMLPLIDESIKVLVKKLYCETNKKAESTEIIDIMQRLTLDIICKCVFGIETNCQLNVNDPFIVSLKAFFSGTNFSSLKIALLLTFPEIKYIFIYLMEKFNRGVGQKINFLKIRSTLMQIINARKQSSERRFDLLQLLLDSEVSDKKMIDEDAEESNNLSILEHEKETITNNPTPKISSKQLTTEEVIAQATLFVFAGYDTSSMAMSYILYSLAVNSVVQDKLATEIDDVFKEFDKKDINLLELYDSIAKLPYLNAVIYETLRFYPFVSTIMNRMCLKSEGTHLSNGQYIPKDANIIINVHSLHFDNDIWGPRDPHTFCPERFLQMNGTEFEFVPPSNPLTWLPFGGGPRNCIGKRLALMIMKLTLCHLIHQFRVMPSPSTEIPLKLKLGTTICPVNGIHIAIKERKY